MTTTPTTPLDQALERVLRLLGTARLLSDGTTLGQDLREAELTIHEVLEISEADLPQPSIETAHAALTAAEAVLDELPLEHRPLWLLPMRAELAILRRRSAT